MKKINVVGAIIIENKKLFSAKRGEAKNPEVAYKYEFVGGKIEEGESGSQAIVREVFEETDMKIEVVEPFMKVVYQYAMYEVTLETFICTRLSDYVVKEHICADWLDKKSLDVSTWAPADEPILIELIKKGYV